MKPFLVDIARPLAVIITTILVIIILFQTKLAPVFHTTQTVNNDFAVTGEGTVTTPPDQAEISLGIIISDASVKSAQTRANAQIETARGSLSNLGIKPEDIQTTSYSINPNYDFTNSSRSIKDYSVNIILKVTVRDLTKVGEVIDAATAGGLNTINGLTFTVSDPQKALDQARELAVADAKRKASLTAKTAGFTLGRIINYAEFDNSQPRPYALDSISAREGLGGSESAVNPTAVDPGASEIKLTVTLTYQTL